MLEKSSIVPIECGIVPVKLFKYNSILEIYRKLPIHEGIDPTNTFEFNISTCRISNFADKKRSSHQNKTPSTFLPRQSGRGPVSELYDRSNIINEVNSHTLSGMRPTNLLEDDISSSCIMKEQGDR